MSRLWSTRAPKRFLGPKSSDWRHKCDVPRSQLSQTSRKGAARRSNREFGRFLEIALGSAAELHAQIDVARLLGLGDDRCLAQAEEATEDVKKISAAYSARLEADSIRKPGAGSRNPDIASGRASPSADTDSPADRLPADIRYEGGTRWPPRFGRRTRHTGQPRRGSRY